MRLYVASKPDQRLRYFLLVGVGLVGEEIAQSLCVLGAREVARTSADWGSPAQLQTGLLTLLEFACPESVTVIWSAGKSGFSACVEDTTTEMVFFSAFLAVLDSRRAELADLRLLLVSSAGGLFEGVRLVDTQSNPDPQRPYGVLKLWQERAAADCFAEGSIEIFRMSTVYGVSSSSTRRGLISVLIDNIRASRSTAITGSLHTLRDYVLAADLGRFIARRAFDAGRLRGCQWPVAARPSSIGEVVRLVEQSMGRRAMLHYSDATANGNDITFSPTLRPADWYPGSLQSGIARCVCRTVRTADLADIG